MKQETEWMGEQLLVTLAMFPSSFTSFRVIEDSCGRIARVNVACRVTIWPHLLFLGNGTSRADERALQTQHYHRRQRKHRPFEHFSARRLGAARPPCRTQNNDGSRFDTAATGFPLPFSSFFSPSFSRSLPPSYASKIFLRYVTDRPSVVSRVS